MALLSTKTYFLALSFIATVLLWGVSFWNGTVKALVMAFWYGVLEDGTPFKTSYTGIVVLDFPLSLLVAFFFYGTNGTNRGYQLFLIDAYSTLQSAFVWLYVESARESSQPGAVKYPIICGTLWQCFGGAISLPLYYYYHLNWLSSQSILLPSVPSPFARALPISFVVGALAPAVIGMLPTWIDRSDQSHQTILAAWQADPLWVSLIQVIAVPLLGGFSFNPENDQAESTWWIRTSYLMAVASSATGHLYAMLLVISADDPLLSFGRMYIPHLYGGHAGLDGKLLTGPWLFLQYDLIIIAVSSLSWAYFLTARFLASGAPRLYLLCLLLLGGLVLGPGATVSVALYWREDKLYELRAWGKSNIT